MPIDLHLHSTHSDGTLTPAEIIAAAKSLGLSAVALTDHNTVSGLAEFMEEAEKNGVILVNKNEINEYAPEQKAAPQSAFITTDVNAYYLPIINAKTEYALSSTDKIRLEKGAKINPS